MNAGTRPKGMCWIRLESCSGAVAVAVQCLRHVCHKLQVLPSASGRYLVWKFQRQLGPRRCTMRSAARTSEGSLDFTPYLEKSKKRSRVKTTVYSPLYFSLSLSQTRGSASAAEPPGCSSPSPSLLDGAAAMLLLLAPERLRFGTRRPVERCLSCCCSSSRRRRGRASSSSGSAGASSWAAWTGAWT